MTYNTYDAIVARVQEVGENTSQEFLDYIPSALRAAELRLTKDIDTLGIKQNLEVNTAIGNRVVAKPTGFRFAHDVFMYDSDLLTETRLKHVPDDYLRDYWPTPATTGVPKLYAQDYDNDNMVLAPTPNKVYTLRISCGADLTALSASNQENYFSKHCGEILYYATMVEIMTFERNANLRATFEDMYTKSIEALNNQGRRARRDDGFAPLNPSGGQNTLKGSN